MCTLSLPYVESWCPQVSGGGACHWSVGAGRGMSHVTGQWGWGMSQVTGQWGWGMSQVTGQWDMSHDTGQWDMSHDTGQWGRGMSHECGELTLSQMRLFLAVVCAPLGICRSFDVLNAMLTQPRVSHAHTASCSTPHTSPTSHWLPAFQPKCKGGPAASTDRPGKRTA